MAGVNGNIGSFIFHIHFGNIISFTITYQHKGFKSHVGYHDEKRKYEAGRKKITRMVSFRNLLQLFLLSNVCISINKKEGRGRCQNEPSMVFYELII